jgi:hypothetical protein
MEHLNPEVIARLVDEAPTLEEGEHLAECSSCACLLDGMKQQTAALGALPDPQVPPGLRLRVESELVAEGLVRGSRRAPAKAWDLSRVAAAVALFAVGAASGSLATSGRGGSPAAVPITSTEVTNAAEAAEWLQTAEAEYVQAVTRYAELAESGEGLDPLNRLAALEGIVLTTGAALREAPADPVINNYHLTALGQRDALLHQLQLASADDEWF